MTSNIVISPSKRIWKRFKSHSRAYYSLIIFSVIFLISLFAEFFSNDKPIILSYDNKIFLPLITDYPETDFGGDFQTSVDYLDPYILDTLRDDSDWIVYPLNRYSFNTINYFSPYPNPAAPSSVNLLGTDDRGRDVLARLIYGFRISVFFWINLNSFI